MPESAENIYDVVLLTNPGQPNELGEMTEAELYAYLANKLGKAGAESVLSELTQNGLATAEFDGPLNFEGRLEIRRREPEHKGHAMYGIRDKVRIKNCGPEIWKIQQIRDTENGKQYSVELNSNFASRKWKTESEIEFVEKAENPE